MPEFSRRGHHRTNANGTTYWVRGHDVVREEFNLTRSGKDLLVNGIRVVPNVTCKHCGAKVFFFENEHGSKVFFDNLGPPWPKHSCYHLERTTAPRSKSDRVKKWVANTDSLSRRAAELDARVAARKAKEDKMERAIQQLDETLLALSSQKKSLMEKLPRRKNGKRKRVKKTAKTPIEKAFLSVCRKIDSKARQRDQLAKMLFEMRF